MPERVTEHLCDLALLIAVAPIGAAAAVARGGLTLLESAVRLSEYLHDAWELNRHVGQDMANDIELQRALAETYRIEATALRRDVTHANEWRDRYMRGQEYETARRKAIEAEAQAQRAQHDHEIADLMAKHDAETDHTNDTISSLRAELFSARQALLREGILLGEVKLERDKLREMLAARDAKLAHTEAEIARLRGHLHGGAS